MDDGTLRHLRVLGGDLCALWAEAGAVVWLRSLRLAQGDEQAAKEVRLMISEKVTAQRVLLAKLATGQLGTTPLAIGAGITRFVLTGVRANRRRLMRD